MARRPPNDAPPHAAPQAARRPLQPAKLTDFKMAGALGSGATAKVYEAVHIASGNAVAIKILEPSQSGAEMRERFAREAVLLAGVSSKHVGNIVGFGFERGQPFLVLERLHGETLDAKLRRDGPVTLPVAVRWIEQLLLGVRDCHDQQIIHRDIKPSNIFLHREGFEETVKLIDFGVARLREVTGDGAGGMGGLTSTNHLIGSMGYMAPEQFNDAKSVGFTADLYAIGVCIFRTLTGRLPFVSRSLEAVIRMKDEQAPPAISGMPNMPKNVLLDWFVRKTMARDPKDRFQNAREMLEQWWNVMASLDEDGATDVMRGIGRVDESYAGPLAARARPGVDTELPTTDREADADSEEDRTVRRQAPVSAGMLAAVPPPPATEQGPFPSSRNEITVLDAAPATLPTPVVPGMAFDQGDEDMPTRTDPTLRALVERELELQKKRKPPPPK